MTDRLYPSSVSLRPSLHPKPARQVLDVLPGHAAGTRAPRRGPFERFAAQFGARKRNAVTGHIALDHGQVFVLAAAVEAEPQAEAVRQRDLLLDRLAGIDRGGAFVLDDVARHQMAPVRRGVEDDVLRPALDAAFEHGLQRLVGGVFGLEGEVVAEHDEALPRMTQQAHQLRQRFDVLAMNFDQLEPGGGMRGADRGMGGLDQRGFPHPARAP